MTHCNYKVKFKDHKRILKTARKEKKKKEQLVTYNGIPKGLISRIFSKNFQGQKRVAWYIQGAERKKKKLPTKNTIPHKVIILNQRKDKSFPVMKKTKFTTNKLAL